MAKFLCITLALCAVASASPILSGSGLGGLTSGLGSLGGLSDLTGAPLSAAQGILGNGLSAVNGASGLTAGLSGLTGLAGGAPLQQAANTVASLGSALPISILNRQTRDLSLAAAIPSQAANAVQAAANTGIAAGKSAINGGVAAAQNAINGVAAATGLPGLSSIASLTNIPLQAANAAINTAQGALNTGIAVGQSAINGGVAAAKKAVDAVTGLAAGVPGAAGLAGFPNQIANPAIATSQGVANARIAAGQNAINSALSGVSRLSGGLLSGLNGASSLAAGLSGVVSAPLQAANAALNTVQGAAANTDIDAGLSAANGQSLGLAL